MITFLIPGRLPSLNEYINACRRNVYLANNMKKKAQNLIIANYRSNAINDGNKIKLPCTIEFKWYEKTRRRDIDNITGYGHKVILDSLVKNGVLKDDNQKNICKINDEVYTDNKNPRIEITIR